MNIHFPPREFLILIKNIEINFALVQYSKTLDYFFFFLLTRTKKKCFRFIFVERKLSANLNIAQCTFSPFCLIHNAYPGEYENLPSGFSFRSNAQKFQT